MSKINLFFFIWCIVIILSGITIKNFNANQNLLSQEFIEDDGQILTPLTAACRYGREKVVEMLLGNEKIDLDKRCTIKFDGHMVNGASALWIAAGSGKAGIFFKILNIHY